MYKKVMGARQSRVPQRAGIEVLQRRTEMDMEVHQRHVVIQTDMSAVFGK